MKKKLMSVKTTYRLLEFLSPPPLDFFHTRWKIVSTVGASPDTNAYLRGKLKVSVFENGQFSEHLIFDKKTFSEK